jgi:cyanophycinase
MIKRITALILFILLFVITCKQDVKHPTIILAGGGTLSEHIYEKFNHLANGKIVVIPSGMTNPKAIPERWKNAVILHAESKTEVDDKFASPLKNANGVWILGGDQLKLSKLYKNTQVETEIKNLLKRGGVAGGTSAGASIFSDIMVYENGHEKGFAILDFIIDQHFSERNRLPRLIKLIEKFPDKIGVGIDECTALIIHGNKMEVIGLGNVFFCFQKQQYTVKVEIFSKKH